jgi:hypothetical protein
MESLLITTVSAAPVAFILGLGIWVWNIYSQVKGQGKELEKFKEEVYKGYVSFQALRDLKDRLDRIEKLLLSRHD